jgi:hypothetical protein
MLAVTIFLASMAMLFVGLKVASRPLRVIVLVYVSAYTVTTVIGATIIAMPFGEDLWIRYGGGVDASLVYNTDTLRYWLLLYAPLGVPAIIAAGIERVRITRTEFRFPTPQIDVWSFAACSVGLSCVCFALLSWKGHLDLGSLISLQNDYQETIRMREQVFRDMGRLFFGLLYVGLPTLAHVAFFHAIKLRTRFWQLTFLAVSATVIVLTLLTVQKAPIFVFLVSLVLGYTVLRGVRPVLLLALVIGGFVLLNLFQVFVLGEWDALQGMFLVFFRMANAFPFYVNLYPAVLPFEGVDLGLDLIDLAKRPSEVETVFNYMYPDISWTQGAAPAAAHLSAYAQAGLLYALLTLIFIGLFFRLFAWLGSHGRGYLAYAFFVQGLSVAYYCTQINLRGVLITNYGIAWALATLALLIAASAIVRLSVRSVRSQLRARDGNLETT